MLPGIIRKVTAHRFVEAEGEEPAYWEVELACGHVLGVLADHFAENVVGHYCPSCEAIRQLRDELPIIGPEAG